MKGLLGFACLLLLGICAGLAHFTVQTEMHAERWAQRAAAIEHVESLNQDLLLAQEYSQTALEATKMLALENGLLCEREAKVSEAYSIIEQENRSLKASLSESVERLEDQIKQINSLMEENGTLKWKVSTLERALKAVEDQKKEDAIKEASKNVVGNLMELKSSADIILTILPLLF